MLSINTNVASLNVQKNLSKASDALSTSLARLSSGLRINSTQDDAARLAISKSEAEKWRQMHEASQTANDALNAGQTIEGGLSHVADILQRARELGVQALNATNTAGEMDAINEAYSALKGEVVRIAADTHYNGNSLLDDKAPETMTFGDLKFDLGSVTLYSGSNPDNGILTKSHGGYHLISTGTSSSSVEIDFSSARSSEEVGNMVRALDSMISGVATARSGLGGIYSAANDLRLSTSTPTISDRDLGIYSDRLEKDYAQEMANLTRNQILQQAGVAVLSQANSLPQSALSLLRG